MIKKRIRIFTYHFVVNDGAVLQAYGVLTKLKTIFPDADIRFIDYTNPQLFLGELLKFRKLRFFYVRRFFLFLKFKNKSMPLDKSINFINSFLPYGLLIKKLDKQNIDLFSTGSDIVWRLRQGLVYPSFPNVYWLSKDLRAKKISFSTSATGYNKKIFIKKKKQIKEILKNYDYISVRDEETLNLVLDVGLKAKKMPDPSFFYKIKKTGVKEKMENLGVDFSKPVLALLYGGKSKSMGEISSYLKSQGYQIVGLSAYNKFNDINLGDKLNPFEWAESFKFMDFVVTERFHGCVFCLKNTTPFIGIEREEQNEMGGKRHQLLVKDFNLPSCYLNISEPTYSLDDFVEKYSYIKKMWDKTFTKKIEKELRFIEKDFQDFSSEIEAVL